MESHVETDSASKIVSVSFPKTVKRQYFWIFYGVVFVTIKIKPRPKEFRRSQTYQSIFFRGKSPKKLTNSHGISIFEAVEL